MLYLLLIIFSLIFSAFFSATETAFVALTPMQIRILSARHALVGRMVKFLQRRREIFLGATVVGNNAANVVFSVAATRYSVIMFGERTVVLVTIAIILIMLVFGEIPPKQLALRYNVQFVVWFIWMFIIAFVVLWPVAKLFSFFSMIADLFFKHKPTNVMEQLSKESLVTLLSHMRFVDNIPANKIRRVTRALTLSDMTVENIMTRRSEVFSFAADDTIAEAAQKLQTGFYSHIPVYDNKNVEHIVGIVRAKKIMNSLADKQNGMHIRNVMEPAAVLQDSHSAEDALKLFERTEFAVVLDEYGGLSGIITLADVTHYILSMHALPNKPHDTNSVVVPDVKAPVITREESEVNAYVVSGETDLSEIEELARVTLDDEHESHTIGGYLAEYTGGGYITDENQDARSQEKIIRHEKLGVFTILEEKNGRIVSLRWVKPDNSEADMPPRV